jgi:SAM-dependent methyltransferase
MSSAPIWHDVECGGYSADLPAWERLAAACSGPVLELGCGTGRVCLHLARLGHEVWGVDVEREFVATVQERARDEGLAVHAVCADATRLRVDREFGLVIAPMQLIQMVGDEAERGAVLRAAAAHVPPGGRVAAAILDGTPAELNGAPAPLADVRERDGRIYSSLPIEIVADRGLLGLRRLRQEVSPEGELTEAEHSESLWLLDAPILEAEGRAVGLSPGKRVSVPSTDGYVGSTVVVLERD